MGKDYLGKWEPGRERLTNKRKSSRIEKKKSGGGIMQRRCRKRWLFAWITALFLLVFCTAGCSGKKEEKPGQTASVPPMILQLPVWKIAGEENSRTYRGNRENPSALYDGDATTVYGGEGVTWATRDLGYPHRLAGVRFLPDGNGNEVANRCLGTKFFVSKDGRNFIPVATIEPVDYADFPATWQEIRFDSAGEYRYLRVEIPDGGAFGEIEWLEYGGWSYQPSQLGKKQDLTLELYAHAVQKEMDAVILTAVYNEKGIMTHLVKKEQEFVRNQEKSVAVSVPQVPGETEFYRVVALEKDGSPAIRNPLCYRSNDCAPELTLPNVFSDDMLLQAEKPLTVWGKAPAGQRVTVTLEDAKGICAVKETFAGRTFSWEVTLGTFRPGGSYTMTVQSGITTKKYENLTFGDVWLCIGQSNMDYFMLSGNDTESYLASEQGNEEAENPNIRLLNLWNKGIGGSGGAVENLPIYSWENAWVPMTPEAASYCSAIGYFFAQELEREYQIPIGLLSVAVGDTEINRWIPSGERYGSFTSTDGGLFYNRVAPFQKLQIRGILMYQGEADQYRTHLTTMEYRDAMAGLVDRYRSIWGVDLPFYWAQLTRYKEDESAVREGQRLALDRIRTQKNAGIISLIDIYGEFEAGTGNCREDIHPHQKEEVAKRFLRYAKRDVYGADIPVSGPVYQGLKVIGNQIEITFATTGNLAVLPVERYTDKVGREKMEKDGVDVSAPGGFEIAGRDGVYYPAMATLEGNRVRLESAEVPDPVSARYAWGAYPEIPNLTDETGLPTLTFTTERFR